jgi:hypothetical protein
LHYLEKSSAELSLLKNVNIFTPLCLRELGCYLANSIELSSSEGVNTWSDIQEMSGYHFRNHGAHSIIVPMCKLRAVVSDTPWLRVKVGLWKTTLEKAYNSCCEFMWKVTHYQVWNTLHRLHMSAVISQTHNIQACALVQIPRNRKETYAINIQTISEINK